MRQVCCHVSVRVGATQVQLGRAGECALCGAWVRPKVGCRVHRHGLGHIGEGRGCIGKGRGCIGEGHGFVGEGHGFIGEGCGSECVRHMECVGEGCGRSECVRCVGMDHGGCTCMGVGRGLGGACGRHHAEKTAAPAHLCLAVTPLTISTASHPLLIYAAQLLPSDMPGPFSTCRRHPRCVPHALHVPHPQVQPQARTAAPFDAS